MVARSVGISNLLAFVDQLCTQHVNFHIGTRQLTQTPVVFLCQ
jgi:hypothetical protein